MLVNANLAGSFTRFVFFRVIFVLVSEFVASFINLRQFLKINSFFSFLKTEAWKEDFLCEEIDPRSSRICSI